MNLVDIKYGWVNVQIRMGISYRYPNPLSSFMREQYCRPVVYRWVVWAAGQGISALYVGETDTLTRRIQQYLRPGPRQATNLRLKAFFDEAVKKGELVELQALEFEAVQINKVKIAMDALGNTHIRKMLESFVLAALQADSQFGRPVVLNQGFVRDADRQEKRIREAETALRRLGMTEGRETIERALQLKTRS
jgi:hypothetical protein